MAAKQRLQELFAKYDTSGDGVLSEEEMTAVFEAIGIKKNKAQAMFQAADADQDGTINCHEFISWLTKQRLKYALKQHTEEGAERGEGKYWTMIITNASDRVGKKVTINFTKCQNMEFPEGNPCEFTLKPGEQLETPVVMKQNGRPWRYSWRSSSKSVFTGIEDDLSNAFTDPDFPHDENSIGKSTTSFSCGSADQWVRARMLGDPAEALLFEEVRPQDVHQGSLGDCWLMAALSCLSDYPGKLKSLFKDRHITEDGKYEVYLFDLEKDEWATVVVDEFLPCKISYGQPRPVFAEPLGEEIWVALLEKAFAKFCGSYGALSGGGVAFAFQVLTGKPDVISYEKQKDATWRRRRLNRERQKKRGTRNPRGTSWTWKNKTPTIDTDKLFEVLSGHCADKHVLGCSMSSKGAGVEEAKASGLYSRHVYSLLKVMTETLDDGSPVRLVHLRNPWGHKEWNGDWADQGDQEESKWKENPQLAERLSNTKRNDGCFYMSFEDWVSAFTCVSLCPVGVNAVPPEEEDPEEEAVEQDCLSSENEEFVSSDRE